MNDISDNMVVVCNKTFNSFDSKTRDIIIKHIDKIILKLNAYNFKVFNDDSVFYKVLKNNFFITKISSKMQLRLLCRLVDKKIELHDISCKNRQKGKLPKSYIYSFVSIKY